MFIELTGHEVCLIERGVYRQCPLYTNRDGFLFARVGSGFIRLNRDGTTSKAGARVDLLVYDGRLYRDSFGRLTTDPAKGKEPLVSTPQGILPAPSSEHT